MKKIIFTLIISIIFSAFSDVYATGKGCPSGYGEKGKDFCFTLRVGDKREFRDQATNPNNFPIKFKGSKVTFSPENGYKYNGGSNPHFNWSNWIRNRRGIMQSKQTGLVLKATSEYEIKYRPSKRSYKNLTITYDLDYIKYKDNKESGPIKTHREIAHYQITWCGDGVLDTSYGEKCDPNDTSKKGWGNIGCTTTCKPVNGELCGNGVKDGSEQCDPTDPNKVGWGNKGCSETCKTQTGPSCDQTFKHTLRHGRSYKFGDEFINNSNTALKIQNFKINFNERKDFNGSSSTPYFEATDWIKNKNYVVNKGERGMIANSTQGTRYAISYYPKARNNQYDDIKLVYTTNMSKIIGGKEKGYYIHTECDNYEITWCGDGVRDNYIETDGNHVYEECDPNDPSKNGWDTANGGSCNNSCQVVYKDPVCNSLTYYTSKNPIKIGKDTRTKTISCTATNAEKIKIDCGNGTTEEFTGNKAGKKTVQKKCFYKTVGTYTPKCTAIRGAKRDTGNSCQKKLTVIAATPAIEIIKTDANTADKDGKFGTNDSQTVIKGDKAVFKITVTNIGDEKLKNIEIKDPNSPSCNRSIEQIKAIIKEKFNSDVLDINKSFSYTCEKPNARYNYINKAYVTGVGVISNKNVNDDDTTDVKIVTPSCRSLTYTQDKKTVLSDVNFTCNSQYSNSYRLQIKDSKGKIVHDFNSSENNKFNYIFNTADTYTATCYINDNITSQACIKKVEVIPASVPSITIDKTDTNHDKDRDNNIKDTQTLYKGDKAIFKIKITNNGNEDLKNIVLTDEKSPNCAGNVTLPSTKPSTFKTFKVGGEGNHNDNYLQPGEWFEYICEGESKTEKYTNTIKVDADGKNTNSHVNKSDTSEVLYVEPTCTNLDIDKTSGDVEFTSKFTCTGKNTDAYKIYVKDEDGHIVKIFNSDIAQYNFTKAGKYSVECYMNNETETEDACKGTVIANKTESTPKISIIKTDENDLDKDGKKGTNDSQTLQYGDEAVFRITVENTGNEDLTNIVLTDKRAPNCAGAVVVDGHYPDTFLSFDVIGKGNHNDAIFQPGEKFTYTCKKDNTTEDYTNIAEVKANSTVDGDEVKAKDDTEVKTGIYDLALVKKVINKKEVYKKGDKVDFEIIVTNQGTIDANDVVVTDYIPEGLILKDVSWVKNGDSAILATRTIGKIEAGKSERITISFEITKEEGKIINLAEISDTSDDYTDCDSTPDQDKENDNFSKDFVGDEVNPVGCFKDGDDEDDHDPAEITVTKLNPSIKIEKFSGNNGDNSTDLDDIKEGDEGENESQLLNKDVKAIFKIRVTNNGGEDLKEVVVTDILDGQAYSACNKVIGELSIGKSFEYTCEGVPTTKNYTNVAKVNAKGKDTNTALTDENDTKVVLNAPAIKIEKFSGNTGTGSTDLDGTTTGDEGENESQLLNKNVKAIFKIRVTNIGNEDLKEVVIEDTLAASCKKTAAETKALYETDFFAVNDSFEYTCEGGPTTETYTNLAKVTAKGKDSNTGVEDTNTTEVKLKSDIKDCEAEDKVSGHLESKISSTTDGLCKNTGETVVNFISTSEGNTTSYMWSCKDTNNIIHTNGNCNATFTSGGVVGKGVIEILKYSAQGASDLDSNKTMTPNDDTQTINKGDTAKFTIKVTNPGTKNLVDIVITDDVAPGCSRTKEQTKELLKTVGTKNHDEVLNPDESFEYTCEKANAQSDYTNTAKVNAITQSNNKAVDEKSDTTEVKIKTNNPSHPGGSSLKCNYITLRSPIETNDPITGNLISTKVSVTCDGSKDKSQIVDCGKGAINRYQYKTNNSLPATFTCEYNQPGNYKIICGVSRSTNGGTNINKYKTSFSCREPFIIGNEPGFCGDGILQPKGADNIKCNPLNEDCSLSDDEECDGGTFCTSNCKLITDITPPIDITLAENCSDADYYDSHTAECSNVTYPSGGEIQFGEKGSVLIGNNKEAFAGRTIYIKNIGDEKIDLPYSICIYNNNSDRIFKGQKQKVCKSTKIGTLFPDETNEYKINFETDINRKFKSDISLFTENYKTNELHITLEKFPNHFAHEKVYVTVAKPGVAVNSGISYIEQGQNDIANINAIANEISNENEINVNTEQTNIQGTLIGTGSNSYGNNGSIGGDIYNNAGSEGNEYTNSSGSIIGDSTNGFHNYNGLGNVYYSNDDTTIDINNIGDFNNITEPTTFIVENGDLTIEENIKPNYNIAFIVKGGDIIVKNTVTELKGTYVTIGGNIKSAGINEDNQLVINGSVYGNMNHLRDHRTHIKLKSDGNIEVGTVINYNSNLLNKPAPLVSKFIGEYIESIQIAQ